MRIRLAQREDLPAINSIYNQAVRQRYCTAHLEPVSMEWRGQWYDKHDPDHHPVFVADSGNRVLAWISLGAYRSGRQALAHVAEVSYYVDEHERGKGIGTHLMEHAIKVAPDYDFTVLIAILLNKNPASIALLRRYGFSEWGAMPGIAIIEGQTADHIYYGLKI